MSSGDKDMISHLRAPDDSPGAEAVGTGMHHPIFTFERERRRRQEHVFPGAFREGGLDNEEVNDEDELTIQSNTEQPIPPALLAELVDHEEVERRAVQNFLQNVAVAQVISIKRGKRGKCPTCGIRTHKIGMFGKKTPLTVEGACVYGRCLLCHPLVGRNLLVEDDNDLMMSGINSRDIIVENDNSTISGISMDAALLNTTHPVATFESNFVRNSIDHVYTGTAESPDESQQGQVSLSVRSEDVNAMRRLTLPGEYHPSVRSAPDATFDDEFDEPPSRSRGRRNCRGLRKWIKKRSIRRQECKDENDERTESPRHVSPRRNKRRSRRRSRAGEEAEVAPAVPPTAPITEVQASMSSAVSADFIGNVYEPGVLSTEVCIEPDDKEDTTAPTVQAENVDVEAMLQLAQEEADLEQIMNTIMDPLTVKSMLNDLKTSCKPQARGEGCPLSSAFLLDEGVYNDTFTDATIDDEFDEAQSQRRGPRNFRWLRKWIKKRSTRRQECKDENDERTESPRHVSPRRNKRRSRRRSKTGEEPEVAPAVPPTAPTAEVQASMSSAVSADFIGNVYKAGVPSAETCTEPDEEEDTTAPTVQAEKFDVETMLHLAQEEEDLEQSMDTIMDPATVVSKLNGLETSCKPQSRGEGCPLSSASLLDEGVCNDALKIVMIGDSLEKSTLASALRNSGKKSTPRVAFGVDVHTWTHLGVKFSIWDVQCTSREDGSANAWAHPSTQSLFFSPNSLYVLVWDLAANNIKAERRGNGDEEDYDNQFHLEEANRQADAALKADIYEHVLAWVDCIPASNSAILPVVTIPEGMDETEVQRRCSMMQGMLMNRLQDKEPKLFFGNESILRVDFSHGVEELQATIVAIATGLRERVFDHVGSLVPPGTEDVLKIVRRLKRDHKVILLDHLMAEMNVNASVQEVTASLHFLASIGELLYFGTDKDDVLSRYVVLSFKWLVSALSCILRNELKLELVETRRVMNMQRPYVGQAFKENEILKTLLSATQSSCPILSSTDASMLWQNMSFMREAADRTSQLCETTKSSTMFEFLERLLVQKGVFLPLNVSNQNDPTPTYFVPSLLAQVETSDVWTYKTSDSWKTTLCHSWLLMEGAPVNLMEHVSLSLIQDLSKLSQSGKPSMMNNCLESHDTVGHIKINHINVWKSSVLVDIGCYFDEPNSGAVCESSAEIFVSLVNPQSVHCVSSRSIESGTTRLVICGRGLAGHHGRELWKSGYRVVLDSIRSSVAHLSNVDCQVVCPECLAQSHPSKASTWAWDYIHDAAQTDNQGVRCRQGHLVDTNLLCGTCKTTAKQRVDPTAGPPASKPVASLLESGSVVLVGLWDEVNQRIEGLGSGFIVDQKNGLIVTAGHILFNMFEGPTFGEPHCGIKHPKAVIGVIPDGSHTVKFRYFAEIIAHDIANIDACVLQITTKMDHDVEGDGKDCANQSQISLFNNMEAIKAEKLLQLKMTPSFELEETVRIIGFNQGGKDLLEQGKHVNRCADFAKGYICKKFKAPCDDESTLSSSSTSFCPREEIVVMCSTINGHSGGPCVNDEGMVVGILSRVDPVDWQRCYLVPSSELESLVKVAKSRL